MAEIFGLVAGGVSIGALAGQVASSVVKLKSYLDHLEALSLYKEKMEGR